MVRLLEKAVFETACEISHGVNKGVRGLLVVITVDRLIVDLKPVKLSFGFEEVDGLLLLI
jgi:hypothetical protein